MARISELHYSNAYARDSGISEFLEVSLSPSEDPADFVVSFYQANGQVGIEIGLTDPGVQFSIDPQTGEYVYVISADNFNILLTDPDGGGANNYEAYALVNTDTAVVEDFYDIGGGTQNITAVNGAAAGATSDNLAVLTGPNSATTTLQFNLPNPDTLTYETVNPGDSGMACFVAGSCLDTPTGPRRVEDIEPGDVVLTRDNGAQPVRWIGSTTTQATGRHAPICITRGTLGATQDVYVSPQHRLLVSDWRASLLFGEDEVLVAAKSLVNGDTIYSAPRPFVQYVHLMFDQHEIVDSAGLASESFFPGSEGLNNIGNAAAEELFELFPELRFYPQSYGSTARTICSGPQTALLAAA